MRRYVFGVQVRLADGRSVRFFNSHLARFPYGCVRMLNLMSHPASALRLRHIRAGTAPRLRRDGATSAPGLRHVCAGT